MDRTNQSEGNGSTGSATQLAAAVYNRPYARRGMSVSDEMIRVLVADDHQLVREGIRVLLRAAPDILVVGDAENGRDAIALAERLSPQVLLLDLDMPGGDGVSALGVVRDRLPDLRVLVLTMHAESERLLALLEAGARGYLSKAAAAHDLIEAIRVVAGGEIYVRPAAARLLASAIALQSDGTARGRFRMLSERERTILHAVAQGYSGAEIARRLHISSKTVDAYKRRVEEKLGLHHRTEYVQFALEAGILGA
ncbi:MAG TPA: response regulator transcription factor [Gemmatimonadaceae bacterium]|jgi:DNA-binding NarL/FixJ family response regulator